jgi:hypothetical protein
MAALLAPHMMPRIWQVRLTMQHFMTNPKTRQYQVFGVQEAV